VSDERHSDSMAGDGELSIARVVAEPEGGGCQVVLSDGNALEMAADAAELQGLAPGRALTREELAGLRRAEARRRAARKVFAWLERRPLSRSRLFARLCALDFEPEVVDPVLDEFEVQGLVDDRSFAEAFIRDQLRRRPVGSLYLRSKLRLQGIAADVAESSVREALPAERELELAMDALARRGKVQDPARALRFLLGRGFRDSLARRVVAQKHFGNASEAD